MVLMQVGRAPRILGVVHRGLRNRARLLGGGNWRVRSSRWCHWTLRGFGTKFAKIRQDRLVIGNKAGKLGMRQI